MLNILEPKNIFILGLIMMSAFSAPAQEPVCRTMRECQDLLKKVDGRINEIQMQAPKSESKFPILNLPDAVGYCAKQGQHLPSVRELAVYAMKFGARGIVDSCNSDDKQCHHIQAVDVSGSPDSFYYSSAGYRRPQGEHGDSLFWSWSFKADEQWHSFGFDAIYGSISHYPYQGLLTKEFSVYASTLCL